MTFTLQNLIALLPLMIVGLTVVVVMLSIAWRRDHFLNATLTVIGLNVALLSLYYVGQVGPQDVTPLLRVDGYSMFYIGLVLLASNPVWKKPKNRSRCLSATRCTRVIRKPAGKPEKRSRI